MCRIIFAIGLCQLLLITSPTTVAHPPVQSIRGYDADLGSHRLYGVTVEDAKGGTVEVRFPHSEGVIYDLMLTPNAQYLFIAHGEGMRETWSVWKVGEPGARFVTEPARRSGSAENRLGGNPILVERAGYFFYLQETASWYSHYGDQDQYGLEVLGIDLATGEEVLRYRATTFDVGFVPSRDGKFALITDGSDIRRIALPQQKQSRP